MTMDVTIAAFQVPRRLRQERSEAAKQLGDGRPCVIRAGLQIGIWELLDSVRSRGPDCRPGSLAHVCTRDGDVGPLAERNPQPQFRRWPLAPGALYR